MNFFGIVITDEQFEAAMNVAREGLGEAAVRRALGF